ncbi:hypothetical protein O3P69_007073 [Scylla paramamosain]|uniref:Major facilitator superfamily (MFS) profile domain-containing protein n=1 Tax=Scylla paramamosain TaxID=85552 RepID=A0AAW0V2C8_SCYPA
MNTEGKTMEKEGIPEKTEPPSREETPPRLAVSYFVMGMSLSWPNLVESHLSVDNSTLFGNQLYLHPWQMDMLNSLLSIGSVFGLLLAGWIVRRLGRQKSLIAAVLPGVLGWAMLGFSYNAYMMLIGRFFDGITSGMVTLAVMTYATEIPDTAFRGTISTITCLMFLMGACVCTAIGIALTWYYVALGNMSVLLVYICIVPFLPESPTFLIVTGQEKRATKVLERLRGAYIDIGNEISLLKKMNDEMMSNTSWSFLLHRRVQKRILVLSMLFIVQAFSGTAVLRANAVRILHDSGVTVNKTMFATLLLLLPIGGFFVLWSLVDRAGRKVCLAISLTLMSVTYIFLGTKVYLQEPTVVSLVPLEPNSTASSPPYFTAQSSGEGAWWITVLGLIVCIFAMNIGIESLPWQLSSEYFPTVIRSQAMSVSVAIGCFIAATALQLYSYMNEAFTTAGLFWAYAAVSGLGVVFVVLCVPETANKIVG